MNTNESEEEYGEEAGTRPDTSTLCSTGIQGEIDADGRGYGRGVDKANPNRPRPRLLTFDFRLLTFDPSEEKKNG